MDGAGVPERSGVLPHSPRNGSDPRNDSNSAGVPERGGVPDREQSEQAAADGDMSVPKSGYEHDARHPQRSTRNQARRAWRPSPRRKRPAARAPLSRSTLNLAEGLHTEPS